MTPDISEILEELVKKVYSGKEVENVSVAKAHQAIISAILEKMPKKKKEELTIKDFPFMNVVSMEFLRQKEEEAQCWNACLTEMRERIKEI